MCCTVFVSALTFSKRFVCVKELCGVVSLLLVKFNLCVVEVSVFVLGIGKYSDPSIGIGSV